MSPNTSIPTSPVRIVFATNALQQLGALVQELGATRALLVSDTGLARAGHVARATEALDSANIHTLCYTDVGENPTSEDARRGAELARDEGIQLIIGLGGGSAMDAAKACNLLLTQTGNIEDFQGEGKVPSATLPMIAIPTTAGTGSEVQSAALISDPETHKKMVIIDPKIRPAVAVLDPNLSLSQPRIVTEASGLDVLTHAVETAVTTARTEESTRYSSEAFRLGLRAFRKILAAPDDLPARASMLLAASYAGLAIECSMLGAAHACANPLTQRYGLRHGFAVGALSPSVVRFNTKNSASPYAALARVGGVADESLPDDEACARLADTLDKLVAETHAASEWRDLGIFQANFPSLAKEAALQRTATFNPRTLRAADLRGIYDATVEKLKSDAL